MSLTDFSLLVYKNARDFYFLIVYPTTLPNSLMNCGSFLVACLGFLCIVSCHLQTVTVFLLSLNYFYFFSSLIAMAWASKTVLNNSDESGHLVLFMMLEGMLSVFHHFE